MILPPWAKWSRIEWQDEWVETRGGRGVCPASRRGDGCAQDKPNILFIVSDDTGYGDLGPYGGGEGRGMPTPNIDALAAEGHDLLLVLRPAELHPGPGRDADRPLPEPRRA